MIDRRRADLERHLEDLRKNDGWHPFQHFVIGLLHHAGYTDVRHSNPRSDFGCDAVAITPDGKRCVVAVSFECTKAKVLKDAKRSLEDPNREDATVLLFITNASRTQTTWTKWKPEVKKLGLELKLFALDTILDVATRDSVWRETCARLGITGHRPGYRMITPYDSDLLRQVLQIRPKEWLAKRIELREWAQLGELRNRLILGKPGAGKTTTLFVHLEATLPDMVLVVEPDLRPEKVEELLDAASGGGVIVFDDAHEKPNELRALMSALRARQRDVPSVAERYRSVRLLLTARSQEWADIQPPFSPTELQDLDLLPRSQVVIGNLSREQCRELVAACASQWGLEAEDRLRDLAANRAAEADASPLYVLSMLAPARLELRLRDEHLAHLPPSVLGLWQLYWDRLKAVEQGLLRLVKLFAVTRSPRRHELFDAAGDAFSLPAHERSRGLDSLARVLWISRESEIPTSLDAQLEAIPLTRGDLSVWDTFVREVPDVQSRVQMHNGTGTYYGEVRVPRIQRVGERRDALLAAENHFRAMAELASEPDLQLRALALNNLSGTYLELFGSETTREVRGGWLRKAGEAVEESAQVYRKLFVKDALAMSLNNMSLVYYALSDLETTPQARGDWLRKAIEAVDEAVSINRELEVQDQLAMSLVNASHLYAALASLDTRSEGRAGWLRKAVELAEESIRIHRHLGRQRELAQSLNTAANRYSAMMGLEKGLESRIHWLRKGVEAVEEAVRINRELGVHGSLALSLNIAANRYSTLASLETQEGRDSWFRKAVKAVEESVRVNRELGLQSNLAISLGAHSRILRQRAEMSENSTARQVDLRSSCDLGEEAAGLFRECGNTPYFLMSLQDVVVAHQLLAEAGDSLDAATVRAVCTEGRELACAMEDGEKLEFFDNVLAQLD